MPCRDGPKYAILGAGISGLSLAWFLKKNQPHCHITLIEKNDKVGGFLQTDYIDGFLFENGPHSLRLNSETAPACLELFTDLQLTSSILKASEHSKARYIFYEKMLHPLSLTFSTLIQPKNWLKLTWPVLKNMIQHKAFDREDLTIDHFFRERFGSYITDYLIDPMTMGIYGGEIQKLSFKSCFPMLERLSHSDQPLLRQLLKQKKKQPYPPISFKQGMNQLIKVFADHLNVDYLLNTTVLSITDQMTPVIITDRGEVKADHLISTLPAYSLASLLDQLPLASSTFLSSIPTISYKIVHLGYHSSLKMIKGFGCISPSWSQEAISGIIFDSDLFPDQNAHTGQTRLTVMIKENSILYDIEGKKFENLVIEEVNRLLGISDQPDYFKCFNQPKAIAQYHIGHHQSLQQLEKDMALIYPHLSFCGTSFYGVSIPSSIAKAKEIAESLNLRSRSVGV